MKPGLTETIQLLLLWQQAEAREMLDTPEVTWARHTSPSSLGLACEEQPGSREEHSEVLPSVDRECRTQTSRCHAPSQNQLDSHSHMEEDSAQQAPKQNIASLSVLL